jgi:predicted MFS family arabinose efflux permease
VARTAALAVAAGVVVANNYYAQPLAAVIAADFHASSVAVGAVLTVVQAAYAVGIALLVPLGDVLECRRLLVAMLSVTTLGMIVFAVSPTLVVAGAAAALVGVTTSAAQILVAVSGRAVGGELGRTIAGMAAGLILGMVLSRAFAGFAVGALGWRGVFALGAALTAAVALLLCRVLPPLPSLTRQSYPELMRSVPALVRTNPQLTRLLPCGASAFASLAAIWTSIGFALTGPPLRLSESWIGLVALIGALGAVGGWAAGRLATSDRAPRVVDASLPTIAAGALVIGVGAGSLPVVMAGLAVIDMAVQATNIATRTMVLSIDTSARSRLNALYATAAFGGAAAGSGLSAVAYSAFGWGGVVTVAAAIPALGWSLWLVSRSPR